MWGSRTNLKAFHIMDYVFIREFRENGIDQSYCRLLSSENVHLGKGGGG